MAAKKIEVDATDYHCVFTLLFSILFVVDGKESVIIVVAVAFHALMCLVHLALDIYQTAKKAKALTASKE